MPNFACTSNCILVKSQAKKFVDKPVARQVYLFCLPLFVNQNSSTSVFLTFCLKEITPKSLFLSSPIKKIYFELSYSPKFQLLKCMLSQEISLQTSRKFSILILKQMLSGEAAKRDVMPPNLNLAGSLKCGWLSNTGSGFSWLVSCVKKLSCSAPGCSN